MCTRRTASAEVCELVLSVFGIIHYLKWVSLKFGAVRDAIQLLIVGFQCVPDQVRYDRVRRHTTLRCAFSFRTALHLVTHLRFVNTTALNESADSKVCVHSKLCLLVLSLCMCA